MRELGPPQRLRERVKPKSLRGVESVIVSGTKGKCRPYLKIEKDAEAFAACNALADELGPLNDPKKAFRVIDEMIGDEISEVFGVITLDLHLRLKWASITGRGESTSVMAPMVPTLRAAIWGDPYAAIIFHVHPSGVEAEPSDADIETTDAFVEAFDIIDIKFLDHLIIAGDIKNPSYYSFLEDKAL